MKSYILLHEDEWMPYDIYLKTFDQTLLVVNSQFDTVVNKELYLTDIEAFNRAYNKAINVLKLKEA